MICPASFPIIPDSLAQTGSLRGVGREAKQRLAWAKLYEQTHKAGLVCRRCGVSRPTLRKWRRRYQVEGVDGPRSRSRRPHHSPGQKVFAEQEPWIVALRTQRRLGARRIQSESQRHPSWTPPLDGHDPQASVPARHQSLASGQPYPHLH
ncbi:MAG: helix-turn-helix domain containing protein [Chloroflexi bacterium]|nr:helix-turn-helix domain containing protein [Chloroflexota bacterium]